MCIFLFCRVVEMYHAKLDDETKERVMRGISEDGKIKLLFATIAFGLGIDIKDIDNVVVWGTRNFLQMYQEVGRCAHGINMVGSAYVYLTGRTLVKVKDVAVLDLVRAAKSTEKQCLRAVMLEKFMLEGMQEGKIDQSIKRYGCDGNCTDTRSCDLCMCCNHCQSKCDCIHAVHDELVKLQI